MTLIRKFGNDLGRTGQAKRSRRLMLTLFLFVVAASVVVDYAGLPLYADLWHLVNRAPVKCGEFTIRVPSGWWARSHGCSLISPSPRYSLRGKILVQMFFNLIATPSVDDPKWRQDVTATLKGEGSTLTVSKDLTVAGIRTVCFEYLRPSEPERKSAIACNVDRRMVVTFFYDDPVWANEFYNILSTVQNSNPSTKPRTEGTAGY